MSPDRESARAIEDRYGSGEAALGRLHLRAGSRRALPLHQPLDRAGARLHARSGWGTAIWDRLVHPDDYPRVTASEAECARSGEALVQEYRLRAADGRWVWIRDEMTVLRGPDDRRDPLFYRGVFLDVTDRKRMESELERLALYDALSPGCPTGLSSPTAAPRAGARDAPPRDLLPRRRSLQADQRQPRPRRGRRGAPRGGPAPQERVASRRHRRALRRRRVHHLVRVRGRSARGSERGGPPSTAALRSHPRRRCGLRLSASIGVALAEPGWLPDGARLIENADAAMYRAKERGGRGRAVRLEDARAGGGGDDRRAGAAARPGAGRVAALLPAPGLARHGSSRRGRGAAAQHPERGLLPPGAFLNVAEESGLIVPLGAWTVREACARIADWSRREGAPRITVSVNLSARELTPRHRSHGPRRRPPLRDRPLAPVHRGHRERGPGRPRLRLPGLRELSSEEFSSRSTTSEPATPASTSCARCRPT